MTLASPGARRGLKIAGFALGAVLFTAAITVAWRGAGVAVLDQAVTTVCRRPGLAAVAMLLPLASWMITSAIFWVLLSPDATQAGPAGRAASAAASGDAGRARQGNVSMLEMSALIGAAGLLNYLPLKPGLVGRIAYHQKFNGISPARSIASVIAAIACGGAAVVLLLLIAATGRSAMLVALPVLPALILAASFATPSMRRRGAWVYPAAVTLRTLDLLAWVGRYAIAFEVVGAPITLMQAAAVAAVSQAALLVPIAGNGLGVREWATALVATSLPAVAGGAVLARHDALSADLLNRAAELVVVVPLGLICVGWLARRRALRGAATSRVQPPPGGGVAGN